MSENPRYNPQIPEIDDSANQKSKREELVEQRIQSESNVETEIHVNKENTREKRNNPDDVRIQSTATDPTGQSTGQAGNQTSTNDGTGSSSRKLGDVGQSSDQMRPVNPTQSSYTDSAELKDWKLKQKQIVEQQHNEQESQEKDKQRLREIEDDLRRLRRGEKQKNEQHQESSRELQQLSNTNKSTVDSEEQFTHSSGDYSTTDSNSDQNYDNYQGQGH